MDFKMSSAICFNLDQSKILSFGKKLMDNGHIPSLFTRQQNLTYLYQPFLK